MGSTITFADFLFEGGENVEIVEMSNSKSDFLSRIGLQESCRQNTFLFRAMMDEARAGRDRLFSSRACLVPEAAADISVQAPYMPEHISEVAFSNELRTIFHHASAETRRIYSTIRSPFPELDLWIIRWTLARAIEGKDDDESESGCIRRIHLQAPEGDSADCASVETVPRPAPAGRTTLPPATTPVQHFIATSPSRPSLLLPAITSLEVVPAYPTHTISNKCECLKTSPAMSNVFPVTTRSFEKSGQEKRAKQPRRGDYRGQDSRVSKHTVLNSAHAKIGPSLVSRLAATFLTKRIEERKICAARTSTSRQPPSESIIAQARRGYWAHVLDV